MPWKGETPMLFGRVNGYAWHGYRSPEIEDENSHRKNDQLPPARPACQFAPPDLIIQDELHYQRPLGTLVGLYETAWMRLHVDLDGHPCAPRYRVDRDDPPRKSQSTALPAPGEDLPRRPGCEDNSSQATRFTGGHARAGAIGNRAPGTRLKTVLIRVYIAFMAAAEKLFED